ncbi:hypothetical protein E3Q06_03795 [Wallemia mellicola]|nr:hypothetical protein E3Q21_03797 [Wallemia mellicola]TIB84224.1 hypothetical protein E3Q20_03773 [Wallemia mellicola]TIC38630.1 hypothetical protein E3Q07_03830 [Wallemia mellicola]TIC45818.1 hypothetical protein E3Q06_03795 [Wallemia mellicola]TIC52152.1 hypothetical protein E3Q04_03586 [Wallemia mellicola]
MPALRTATSTPSFGVTRRHPASLMPVTSHAPALVDLMRSPISERMIDALAQKVSEIIPVRPDSNATNSPDYTHNNGYPSPPPSPVKPRLARVGHVAAEMSRGPPPLKQFIKTVLIESGCQVATVLCTLVLLDRLGKKLPPAAKGMPCTRHRVFFAAMIITAKSLNDCCPKNRHWRKYAWSSIRFALEEIHLMEIQLLDLLEFNIGFNEAELIRHSKQFMRMPLSNQNTSPPQFKPTPSAKAPTPLKPALKTAKSMPAVRQVQQPLMSRNTGMPGAFSPSALDQALRAQLPSDMTSKRVSKDMSVSSSSDGGGSLPATPSDVTGLNKPTLALAMALENRKGAVDDDEELPESLTMLPAHLTAPAKSMHAPGIAGLISRIMKHPAGNSHSHNNHRRNQDSVPLI